METIAVQAMVNRELKRKFHSPAEIARKLNLNPSTVNGMLNRPTLQVQRLAELSEMCKYNFFREIAELLPYEEPVSTGMKTAANATDALNERIKELEMEVKILRQTLKDLVGK
jgi:hypothetical protein